MSIQDTDFIDRFYQTMGAAAGAAPPAPAPVAPAAPAPSWPGIPDAPIDVASVMQNMLHQSTEWKDASIGWRGLAAILDVLDAEKHAVQSSMGTDQRGMDWRFEKLAEVMPAPRWRELLGPQGLQQMTQRMLAGQNDVRWSPETAKLVGNMLTDPTTYRGVGLVKAGARGLAKVGAPVAVQRAMQAAQKGDEAGAAFLGKLGEIMVTGVQKGFIPANDKLGQLFPTLPKWTEFARTAAKMNDALQYLGARDLDLTTIQSGIKQGSLTMQDVMDALPTELRQQIDPKHLEMVVTRMPDTIGKGGKLGQAVNPTQNPEIAYENYKRWLMADMGLDNPRAAQNFYSHFTEWWKGQALGSLSYLQQNIKGGLIGSALAIGKAGPAQIGADLIDNWREILAGTPFNTERALELSRKTNQPIPATLHEQADRALNAQLGSKTPTYLTGSMVGDVVAGGAAGYAGAEATDQNPVIGAFLGAGTMGALPKISGRIRASAQGVETVLREGGWHAGMTEQLAKDVLEMNAEVARQLTSFNATGLNRQVTTQTLPGTAPTTVGTPAAAAVKGAVAGRGITTYYTTTDAQNALNLIQNGAADALKGLRVATVPVTRIGANTPAAPVQIKFGRTDQIAASKLRNQGANATAYRITGAGAPPADVIEEITVQNVRDLDPALLQQIQGLGWTEKKGRNSLTFTNPNFTPWQSAVRQVPGTPPMQVTSVNATPNPPVPQNIIDTLQTYISDRGGQVDPTKIREGLLRATQVTPERVEDLTRALDDIIYQASRKGVDKSNEFNFDYQDLSNLERAITNVSPFATWYLKAVPFFMKQGAKHPVLVQLIGEHEKIAADEKKERGLTNRFAGSTPNSLQTGIVKALIGGRPLEAFHNPWTSVLPFGSLGRDAGSLGYELDKESEDRNWLNVALGALNMVGLGLNPLIEGGLRLGNTVATGDLETPANGNWLRLGAPIAGATALASGAVEQVTGENPGWNFNTNRGIQEVEETVREVIGNARTGSSGRRTQDVGEVAIERRIDELALRETGKSVGSGDPEVADYIRARREKKGPIYEQARNEVAQERGAQSVLGFLSSDLRPDALLTPEEGEIRKQKTTLLIPGDISRKLDVAAEKMPTAKPAVELTATVQEALDAIALQTGEPIPQVAADIMEAPTNATLQHLASEIYRWQTENNPLISGYGPGGSPEARGLANDIAASRVAGSGRSAAEQEALNTMGRAANMQKGGLKASGPLAAKRTATNIERETIKAQNPLIEEYYAWKRMNPTKEIADFLKEKYRT